MNLRISTDIGGTFTDLVCVNEDGDINVAKVSTTSGNFSQAIFDALDNLAEQYRVSTKEILKNCGAFMHGSTVTTNAILTKNTAKIGMILTKGHRDILTLREGGNKTPFDPHVDFPEPYVPRYLTATVTERMNAEGGIEIPLDEEEVKRVVRQLANEFKVEGIAVCLLWSMVNPVHENKIGEIIEKECPGLSYSLSHKVNPIIREYRRAISAAIDASLVPLVRKYVDNLDKQLREKGYTKTTYLVTSSGALLKAEDILKNPIYMIDSGPSMAPKAGLMYSNIEGDKKNNIITVDMGGTSFDVSIISDGKIGLTRESKIGPETLAIMKADIRSIGAGGGSISWLDPGKLVHVGPQSAGAIPGPACYMRGGQEPTVTDANVVLGYLDPDYFLGGRMKIDPQLSEKVIKEKIGKPLNLSTLDAAYTIWTTVNHNMVSAIEDVTIWQGVDPREYLLVSGGGAAGLHIVPIAKELKMNKIIIPELSGVLSAVGGLAADMTQDFHVSHFTDSKSFDYAGVNKKLKDLEKQAREFLIKTGIDPKNTYIEFSTEARYAYQVWELVIPLKGNQIKDEKALKQLVEDFHNYHERMRGVKVEDGLIEFVNWGAQATAKVPKVELKERPRGDVDPSYALVTRRDSYFKELGGLVKTPVYRGDKLTFGTRVNSPAIIQETTSTFVVFPGSSVTVSKWGNYLVDLD